MRTRIYGSFASTGQAPAIAQLAAELGVTEHRVSSSLATLFEAHEVALSEDGRIWMANPFSAVPTPYPVETPDMTCWANCAWDALGVPALLDTDGWIRTECAESREPLEFGIRGGALAGDAGVIHLVTPIRDAWVDIGFT